MSKITLYEYLALPDEEQYDVAIQVGVFLDCFIQGDSRFALYSVDKFFVEIEYNNNQNKINGKRAFVAGDLLDRYSRLRF